MKATIFHSNEHTSIIISKPNIKPDECRENLKYIHTTITSQYLSSRKNNKVTGTTLYGIHSSKQTLPRHMRTKLEQLRANKPSLLQSCLHTVNPKTYSHDAHYACLIHMTLITSFTAVKYQQNSTTLVCGKIF